MLQFIKSKLCRTSSEPLPQVANLQGIGTRARQEDSFAFVNALDQNQYDAHGMMFCVCDGMGGMLDGKLASETAVQSLRESFAELDSAKPVGAQLTQNLRDASGKIAALLGGNGGSTAVLGVIYRGKLHFACVGDSYLYLLRSGNLLRLNAMHNMCHLKYLEAIRNGYLDPSIGRLHFEAAALTSFLGMSGYTVAVDSAAHPLPLQQGDVILACSDGVGGVLDEATLAEAMRASSAQQICQNLTQLIEGLSNPYQDNYTALVIGYQLNKKEEVRT